MLDGELMCREHDTTSELSNRYTELLHTHFKHSVLDSLPDWLQNMDDSYGDGLSMGTYFDPMWV
jgi:hypothetical protein